MSSQDGRQRVKQARGLSRVTRAVGKSAWLSVPSGKDGELLNSKAGKGKAAGGDDERAKKDVYLL